MFCLRCETTTEFSVSATEVACKACGEKWPIGVFIALVSEYLQGVLDYIARDGGAHDE